MKVLVISLLVSSLSTWATTTAVQAQDDPADCRVKIVVAGDGEVVGDGTGNVFVVKTGELGDGKLKWVDKGDGKVFVIKADALGDADGRIAWVTQDDDGRSEKNGKHNFVLRRFGSGKGGGWLGVSIGSVSEALADQLDLDGDGVLIQNVVEGSPADKGGMKVHDIVMSIDGDDVDGDISRAIELVKRNKPGEEIDIIVLRDGRESELTIELGSRSGTGANFTWKNELAPDAEFEDRVRTFGRVMRRGDDGEWSMEDLGDLKMLKELPGNLRMFLPKDGNRSTQVFVEGGTHKVKTVVEEDGNVIVILQAGDGEITVTRVDEDGVETENVYADADELQEADEDAFDLLEGDGGHAFLHFGGQGDHEMKFDFKFDSDEWKERMGEWHEKMEGGLSGVLEIQGDAMEKIHEALGNLEIDGFDFEGLHELKNLEGLHEIKEGTLEQIHEALENLHIDGANIKVLDRLRGHHGLLRDGHGLARIGKAGFGKPKHSFEVRADGTIAVTIRRGDSQMTQLFEDEDDLADRKPKLYEKYEKLMDVDEE